jgi:hypothetical protein
VRFECQALLSIAALAHEYGMAVISATTGVEAAGTICPG